MKPVFYVMDYGYGMQLDDQVCGCVNEFTSYNAALKVCKKVSKENEGKFTVGVMVPSTIYENGKQIED